MSLPLFEKASADLPKRLVNALRLGTWRKREELARCLGVSVRQIRDAAHSSRGEVVSGQLGLKLTVCCTPAEIDDAEARFTSQIHEMQLRSAAIRFVFESRMEKSA